MFSRRRHDDVVIPAKAGIHSFIFSLARPCNSLAGFLWAGVQTLGIQMFSPQIYLGVLFTRNLLRGSCLAVVGTTKLSSQRSLT
jgi:hypothetical protein